MMKKFFWMLSLVCVLSACGDNDDPETSAKKDDSITILSYLVANNNLDDYLISNIGTMYDGLASMNKKATLLIYWDGETYMGSNNSSHLILKYETDGKGNINGNPALDTSYSLNDVIEEAEIVKEYPTQLSVDKYVMAQVLNDMIELSNTTRWGLIFGSHGSAWLNSIFTRSFGQDGSGTDNTILIPDMVEALKSVNQTFEFILFDVCYMATAEVAYAFRDVCNYQIASVMEVPAYGFPYSALMKDLYEGNVEGYQKVCQAYIDYHNRASWGTVSLIDSKEMDNLTQEIKKEIVAHKDILADYNTGHLEEYGKKPSPYLVVDLGHLVKDLNDGTMPVTFSNQLDKAVIYKDCIDKASPLDYSIDRANYSGLGIYVPVLQRPKWNEYFKTLDWYTASGWSEVDFSWNF